MVQLAAEIRLLCLVMLLAFGGCGGGVPSSPTTTPASSTSTPALASIPFRLSVEWLDAEWRVVFQGQTFTGGGLSGSRLLTLSAPVGTTQTLSGTFAKETADGFGAIGFGFHFGGGNAGVLFGSPRLVSGPPRSFTNFCSVAWTEDFSTSAQDFTIQFTMTGANSITQTCP